MIELHLTGLDIFDVIIACIIVACVSIVGTRKMMEKQHEVFDRRNRALIESQVDRILALEAEVQELIDRNTISTANDW